MVSIHNNINGIKGPAVRYQNCNTSKTVALDSYHKMREYLQTQVTIWVNIVRCHIGTMVIIPRYEDRLEWY